MSRPKAPKATPARNQHLGRGYPVTVDDIRKAALPGCRRCRGVGLEPGSSPPRACRCSTRRFLKAHQDIVVDERASAWWPLNCSRCGDPNKPGTDQCQDMCNAAGEKGRAGSPYETEND